MLGKIQYANPKDSSINWALLPPENELEERQSLVTFYIFKGDY